MDDRLYRSRDDRMLAGVAGGLAEHWDVDPSLVRIAWVFLAIFTGGLALVVYIVMAIVVPEQDPGGSPVGRATARAARHEARAARRANRRARRAAGERPIGGALVFGGLLIIVGATFLVREWWPQIDFDWLWPIALIVLGVVVLVAAMGRRDRPGEPPDATGPSGASGEGS